MHLTATHLSTAMTTLETPSSPALGRSRISGGACEPFPGSRELCFQKSPDFSGQFSQVALAPAVEPVATESRHLRGGGSFARGGSQCLVMPSVADILITGDRCPTRERRSHRNDSNASIISPAERCRSSPACVSFTPDEAGKNSG